jgi:hypothetical protein
MLLLLLVLYYIKLFAMDALDFSYTGSTKFVDEPPTPTPRAGDRNLLTLDRAKHHVAFENKGQTCKLNI